MSESQDNKNKNSANKNRRPRRNNKKKSASNKNANRSQNKNNNNSGNSNRQAQGKKKHHSKNNNRRRFYKKRKPTVKLTGEDYIAAKSFNLLEQHLNARKKYFENFNLVDKKTQDKLEHNFVESQKTFLAFKERLNDKDKKIYEEKFEGLKLDLTYSQNRDISPTEHLEITVSKDDIEDPHYLESQKAGDFSDDTEESIGTLDDYKAYKGL